MSATPLPLSEALRSYRRHWCDIWCLNMLVQYIHLQVQAMAVTAGYIDCKVATTSSPGSWERRHGLLDPYSQLLFLTHDECVVAPLAVEASPTCIALRCASASNHPEAGTIVLTNDQDLSLSLRPHTRGLKCAFLVCFLVCAHVLSLAHFPRAVLHFSSGWHKEW